MNLGVYWVLLLAVLVSGDAFAGRRLAVLVGSNRGWEGEIPLRYAEADAQRMKSVLIELGGFAPEDVITLSEPSHQSLTEQLEQVKEELEGSSSQESMFLFYFSGHADGTGMHLRRDASLSFKELTALLDEMPATVKLGIIDACKSGSILATKGGTSGAPPFEVRLSSPQDAVRGTIILTSSGADELSQEARAIAGSFFTHHLVSGLLGAADENGDGKMSLEEVYNYAYAQTVLSTAATPSGPQRPAFDKVLEGRGNLYLTWLKEAVSTLRFSSGSGRCFVVTPDERLLIAEIAPHQKLTMELALPAGEFMLKCLDKEKYRVARFPLKQGERLKFSHLSFSEVPRSEGLLKLPPGILAEAKGNKLMTHAELIHTQRPAQLDLSVLLAVEALRRNPTPGARQVLHRGLGRLPASACVKHDAEVISLAWSPDGRHLATSGTDTNVRIWDPRTGAALSRVSHTTAAVDLAWSLDGKWIFTRDKPGAFRQWEFKPGQSVAPEPRESSLHAVALDRTGGHVAFMDQEEKLCLQTQPEGARILREGPVRQFVTFSADGRFLAAMDASGRARVWDTVTTKEILLTKPVEHAARMSLALSPDGGLLALGPEGGRTVQIWNVDSNQPLSLSPHTSAMTALLFASAKTLLIASEDGLVLVWDVAAGSATFRLHHEAKVESMSVSPDGQWLATTWSGGNSASIWSLDTGKEFTRLPHGGSVNAVAWSPRAAALATASADTTACVWEFSGEELARMPSWGRHTDMALSRTGQVLATATEDEPACLWEATTGRSLGCVDGSTGAHLLALSADGKLLATASKNRAQVWRVDTRKEVSRLLHDGFIRALAFSPDGATLASASRDGTARVWELSTGRERQRVKHDGPVKTVAFSPDGKRLATGGEDQTARLWDLSTGKEVLKLQHHVVPCEEPSPAVQEYCEHPRLPGSSPAVESVLFSADGQYLATATLDAVARLWDTRSGQALALQPQVPLIKALSFSPDGRELAIANGELHVTILDVKTGKELPALETRDGIAFLQYSADGKYLLTLSVQGKVNLWESSSRKESVWTLEGVTPDAGLLSADGRYVATVSDQGNGSNLLYSVYAWRTEDLTEQACKRLQRNLTSEEWEFYLGDEPYQKTCPALP